MTRETQFGLRSAGVGGAQASPEPSRRATRSAVRRLPRLAWRSINRLSLFQQFALLSLGILVVGAYVIGSYVSGEIREKVIHRTSALTALYVDSFVSPHLQELSQTHNLSPENFQNLDQLLNSTAMGQKIVAFKIWHFDGDVVYASEQSLVGRGFPITGGLREALDGRISTAISNLDEEENLYERGRWSRLRETYAPVRDHETGAIIGASEFYEDPSELEAEIASSQRKGWLIVGGATGVMYVLLMGMVRGASTTIGRQHRDVQRLAGQNAELAARVRRAAAQKSETDEELLERLAQDLHDGPAQDISLALLRLDALAGNETGKDAELTRTALTSALREIREMCAGLRLPEIEELTLGEVVEKVAAEHHDKTGSSVHVTLCTGLPAGDTPTKIAIYRVIQEALNNAYMHGDSTHEEVWMSVSDGRLHIYVRDHGTGIDAAAGRENDGRRRLGIRGMRERVEMLGGGLELAPSPGGGTLVDATLPLEEEARSHG
jgi:signal transduction histidine kinase